MKGSPELESAGVRFGAFPPNRKKGSHRALEVFVRQPHMLADSLGKTPVK